MENTYARNIVHLLEKTNYNKVMVIKSKLSDDDVELIEYFANQYRKNVMFATMHDILFEDSGGTSILKY